MSRSQPFTPSRAYAIARKEVFHILRDPFTIAMALALPLVLVTLFGFAIEFNLKNIRLAVLDNDKTQSSRQLLETISSSNYFILEPVASPEGVIRLMQSEHARVGLIVEPGFEKDLRSGLPAEAQVILDGTDNASVGSVASYIGTLQQQAIPRLTGIMPPEAVRLRTRFLYNPELNTRWFIIPGLVVVTMAILSILLTALTVAREWENGSMELLLSTPVQPLEIIVGKLAPYTVLGLGGVAFVYLSARLAFGVPFRGNHLVFLLGCLLFLAAYLAQGLLISVITRKQQLSMQLAMISGLLPSLLMSGFIFPIESMPVFFRYFTSILPAKWFMMISRDVFLKGSGLGELAKPFVALLILDSILIFLAAKKFKKDVEP